MGDTWHDTCMPCGYVQPIKTRLVEENRGKKMRRKRERKKGMKEDPAASSSKFRCSDGRSSSSQELKSATL